MKINDDNISKMILKVNEFSQEKAINFAWEFDQGHSRKDLEERIYRELWRTELLGISRILALSTGCAIVASSLIIHHTGDRDLLSTMKNIRKWSLIIGGFSLIGCYVFR